jgi:hypothetical protein
MGEGLGHRGVGEIVGRHVNRLDRGDGRAPHRSDALLQLGDLGGERRLVAHARGQPPQKARDLRARLHEAEHVVDEEQDVAAGLVPKMLGHRQRAQGDAPARAGRLVHLAEN